MRKIRNSFFEVPYSKFFACRTWPAILVFVSTKFSGQVKGNVRQMNVPQIVTYTFTLESFIRARKLKCTIKLTLIQTYFLQSKIYSKRYNDSNVTINKFKSKFCLEKVLSTVNSYILLEGLR